MTGLKAILSMSAASRPRLETMVSFSRKAARSWRPALALLGYNQRSGFHQAQKFHRSLAKAGIVDKTTLRFTSIAQGLAEIWQDETAGSVLRDWTVDLKQHQRGNRLDTMTFQKLVVALTLVR